MRWAPGFVAVCIAPIVVAQQEMWRIWPTQDAFGHPDAIGDMDGDRCHDVLTLEILALWTAPESRVRVRSGATGVLLYDRPIFRNVDLVGDVQVVGDVDGDGRDEFALAYSWNGGVPNRMQIWSPHRDQMLWEVNGPWDGEFGRWIFGVDLDGDGRREIMTATHSSSDSRVFTFDEDGTPLYTIQISRPNQQWMRGIGPIGDVDGDGAGDIGVGVIETTARGAIELYSGRSGRLIRIDLGRQPGDAIGYQIAEFGDLDRDGVPDYVTSNTVGNRGLIEVRSGANGQVLRDWVDMNGFPARKLRAGVDLDLDGVPDVVGGNEQYVNGRLCEACSWWSGRVAAYSGRDGSILWEDFNWITRAGPGESPAGDISLGRAFACIGPQPGSPYPVVAEWDWPWQIVSQGPPVHVVHMPRLRGLRADLNGTSHSGTGCATSGTPPTIAVRRDPNRHVQVTAVGLLPGAPAWLLLGAATTTTWAGHALPVPLDGWGLPGCSLLVAPELVIHEVAGTTGWDRGYAAFGAPFTVAAAGLQVAMQWLSLDPSTLAHAVSGRHDVALQ